MRYTFSGARFEKAALDHEILKVRGWKGLQNTPISHSEDRETEALKEKFTQHINDRCRTRASCPHSSEENFNPYVNWIFLVYTKLIFWANKNWSMNILRFGVLAYSKLVYDLFVNHQLKKLKWLTKKENSSRGLRAHRITTLNEPEAEWTQRKLHQDIIIKLLRESD